MKIRSGVGCFRAAASRRRTPRRRATPSPIVGVVRDIKTGGLEAGAAPLLYRSVWQVSNLNLTLVVRASGDPAQLSEANPARGARG
jgi:hypothetical protein